jgi:16S rRNA (uracil1498-N3)-methyltransferase
MEYYYIEKENIDFAQKKLTVQGEEYKHLSKILGKKEGDKLTFTDGKGMKYECEIIHIDRTLIECSLLSYNNAKYDSHIKLNLLVTPLKNPSRFEFIIEKAVELGVFKIIPVITDNTVIKSKFSKEKLIRLNKISQVSSLLSQRCFFPEVEDTKTFSEIILNTKNYRNKILMYEFADTDVNADFNFEKGTEVFVFVGPEGGFSAREVETFKNDNWRICSLGSRKVRAETAAIISAYKILNNF